MNKPSRTVIECRKTVGLVTLAITGSGLSGTALAAIQVQLDGQPLATAVAPIQRNGSTLVPMRDIFEALGATLNWNSANQTITAQKGQSLISLQINSPFANVNGKQVVLNQAAILYGGRTMVPLRFVSEAMGANVQWNSALQQIAISTPQTNNAGTTTAGLPNNGTGGVNIGGAGTAVAGMRTISIPSGAVVPVTLDTNLSSATTRVGQRFTASVMSRRIGDSEFPPGSKLEGIVTEARPKQGNDPGVLDFDFQTVVLTDGTRYPLHGELTALDDKNVISTQGRLIAKESSRTRGDRLKIAGIGAGVGFVLGKVLNTNTTATTVLGGIGGYLFGRNRERRAAEAMLAEGTKLGVRLNDPITYTDSTGYASNRETFLRTSLDTTGIDQNLSNGSPRVIAPVRQTGGQGGQADQDYPDYAVVPNRDPNRNPNNDFNRDPNRDIYPPIDNNYINDRNGFDPPRNNSPLRRISVPAGVVVPVTVDAALSSATARVGQRFTASIASQRLGDSEFPAGSKIEGIITEARPKQGNNPGVLDLEFQNVILPDGTRQPIQGELIALDQNNVTTNQGRMTAKTSSRTRGDRLKIAGIGAGVGFVLGKVLNTNSTLTTVLGGVAGYIYGNKRETATREAVVPQGTRLGVRLNEGVNYIDGTNYYQARSQFLRVADANTNASFNDYFVRDDNDTTVGNGRNYTPRYYTMDAPRNISVPEGIVVPVTLDTNLSSASARVGQEFTATVVSQQLGDSEFPAGSKIEGVVVEARPKEGDAPGVLDLDFQTLVLPDGTRQGIQGELTALDDKNVTTSQGRLTAKSSPRKSGDRLKIVGIGAGVGFVLGKVLKQNTTLSTVLGAVGGFLYDRSKNKNDTRSAEATIQQGTKLGIRLGAPVTYTDATGYGQHRVAYLRQ